MKTDLPSVYLDSCCFIDMVKVQLGKVLEAGRSREEWFYRQMLLACSDGNLVVYTSQLTMNECTGGDLEDHEDVQRRFDAILRTADGVIPVGITYSIQDTARGFSWRNGIKLKSMDALHVACALKVKAAEFITTDGDSNRSNTILKQATKLGGLGLRVIHASQSLQLPEDYRQPLLELKPHENTTEEGEAELKLTPDGVHGSPEETAPNAAPAEAESQSDEGEEGKAKLMSIFDAPPLPAVNATQTIELKDGGMSEPKLPSNGEGVEKEGVTDSPLRESEIPDIPPRSERRRLLDI